MSRHQLLALQQELEHLEQAITQLVALSSPEHQLLPRHALRSVLRSKSLLAEALGQQSKSSPRFKFKP